MQGFISTFSNAVVDFCRRAIIVYKMCQKQIKHMFGPKGINYFLNTTIIYRAKILLHGYSKLKQHKDLCHVEHYNMTRFGWICSEKLRWKEKTGNEIGSGWTLYTECKKMTKKRMNKLLHPCKARAGFRKYYQNWSFQVSDLARMISTELICLNVQLDTPPILYFQSR